MSELVNNTINFVDSSQGATSIQTSTQGAYSDWIPVYDKDSAWLQLSLTVVTPSDVPFASTDVSTTTDLITIANHGLFTGLKVVLTTSGVLPTGLAVETDYYIVRVSSSTFGFATTYANAVLGTLINITAAGSGSSNVDVTALAGGKYALEGSNDKTIISPIGEEVTLTAAVIDDWNFSDTYAPYIRIRVSNTAGALGLLASYSAKTSPVRS